MSHKIYLITGNLPFKKQMLHLKQLLPLGLDYLQYREKNKSTEQMRDEIHQLKLLCDLYETKLIVNDYLELALETGADGLHLGQDDFSLKEAKKMAPAHFIIGQTVKTVEQAKKAIEEGADYLGVGAIFPSSTKPHALPVTLETLGSIRQLSNIPLYAIGGITPQNLSKDLLAHIDGLVACHAIWNSSPPEKCLYEFNLIVK